MLAVAVTLVVGLFLSVAPVPASTVSWSTESIPSTSGYVLFPGANIVDLAVSDDGTMYVVTGNDYCYKSTNGGVTWSQSSYTLRTRLNFVGVAPDDSDVVAVAGGTIVWMTINGGDTWELLGTVNDATAGGTQCAAIADITVSASDGAKKYVGVAGNTKGGMADFWYSDAGATSPKWQSTAKEPGFDSTQDTGLAIAFSPNVASDKVMVAIAALSTTNTTFQMFFLSTKRWNTVAGFSNYPVNIQNGSNDIDGTDHAAIAMAPDYLGSDDAMRIAFVGLATGGSNIYGGVYRLKDTTDKAITDDKNIKSVDYDGTNLVAGAYDSTKVYRSDNPLATSPSVSTASTLKRPGGQDHVTVAWRGSDVVAGTVGNESAFAVSRDNGKTFNDVSLIDTTLPTLSDVAVSPDGSKVYLASDDGTDLSLWRYTSSWKRGAQPRR